MYVIRSTLLWLQRNHVDCLPWPALSTGLNPTENHWGVIATRIYRDGKQYGSSKEINQAIMDTSNNLYYSIPKGRVYAR